MGDINIKGTLKTPSITFSKVGNHLVIKGRSTHENPARFYRPLISILKKGAVLTDERIEIDIKLEYFNTPSSLVLLDVLKQLQSLNTTKNEVVINWYYDEEDEDLLEVGKDYSRILNNPLNLIVNPN